jgi:hypothetical protein
MWNNPVVGIEETAVVSVSGTRASVVGTGRVKVFSRDGEPRWFERGEDLHGLRSKFL